MGMSQQFDQLGYTVFSNFLDTETTACIRAKMDSLHDDLSPELQKLLSSKIHI